MKPFFSLSHFQTRVSKKKTKRFLFFAESFSNPINNAGAFVYIENMFFCAPILVELTMSPE